MYLLRSINKVATASVLQYLCLAAKNEEFTFFF